jgi:D-alanine-D-alanine ligase
MMSSQAEMVDSGSIHHPKRFHPPRRAGRVDELERQMALLLERLNIAVIYGGDKQAPGAVLHQTMNTRSWKSYETVARDIADALVRLGCRNVHVLPENMMLAERLREHHIHMAWLNSGGVQGQHPMLHAAAMLEMLGIPYVGHSPLSAGILDNKDAFKRQLQSLGLPTAPFVSWPNGRGPFVPSDNARFAEIFGDYAGPFVVKPANGRASLHVHVIDRVSELSSAIASVQGATGGEVLIERFLPGREFCVAVAGPVISRGRHLSRLGGPFVFSIIERRLESDERIFTSMDVRPITPDRLHLVTSDEDPVLHRQLEELARAVYLDCNLETLVRLDVRMDLEGHLHVLEANPKPDMKLPGNGRTSLVCVGLPAYAMDYDDLVLALLSDRVDSLFSHQRGMATSLTTLLE